MSFDPKGRSVLQLAAALAEGATDPVALAKATLGAIEACPDKAIFTALTPDRALEEAEAAAERHREGRPLSLLDGIPVAWKDLFDFKGEVTRAGAVVLPEVPASVDAALLQRFAAVGSVAVGKLNLTEFAYSGLGLNPHYGTPMNPWSRDEPRVPGGSSSASGVAVARGLVAMAIGSDTGGSVRIPAAFNGVVGYKSTGGRWPIEGAFPLSTSLDTAGVLCRTVVDAVIADAAARGLAAPDLRRGTLQGLRIVTPTNVVLDDLEPAVAKNFAATLHRLSTAGAKVESRRIPAFDAIVGLTRQHGALANIEAYRLHKDRLEGEAASRMDRRVVARLRLGATITAEAERAILASRAELIAEGGALFDGATLVAYPTIAHTAPPIAALEADDDLFVATNLKTLRNTLLGNFLDWCGVSIPNGFDDLGLPTGFLLSGGPNSDDHLLATALVAEPLVRA